MDDVVGLVWTGLTYLRNRPRIHFTHFLISSSQRSVGLAKDLRKHFDLCSRVTAISSGHTLSGGLVGNTSFFFLKNNPFFSSLTRPLPSRESLGKITIQDYLKITPGRSPTSWNSKYAFLPPCWRLSCPLSSSLLLVLNTPHGVWKPILLFNRKLRFFSH